MTSKLTLETALEQASLAVAGGENCVAEKIRGLIDRERHRTAWMRLATLLGSKQPDGESSEEEREVERLLLSVASELKSIVAGLSPQNRSWKPTVQECATRDDFLALFRTIGVPGDLWKSHWWLSKSAGEPPEQDGIGFNLYGLSKAINEDQRWVGFAGFLRWMGCEPGYSERVREIETREDYLAYFAELGIPDGKWRTGHWLVHKAKLPAEQGGLGKSLSGLKSALQHKFGNRYQRFISWMDGKEYVEEEPYTKRLTACETPADVLAFFAECGVPEGKWRLIEWLLRTAREPEENGGVGQTFIGIGKALYQDPRWGGSHPRFVAWMDGKEAPDEPLSDRVRRCATKEDFLALFASLGIPGEAWKKTTWFFEKSGLPHDQGGIGRSLSHVVGYVQEKFGTWDKFLAFMDVTIHRANWKMQVDSCATPADFLALFASLGIPGDAWEDSQWMGKEGSALPKEQGGIGKSLAGLRAQITKDDRFGGSYVKFVAWMHEADIDDATAVDRLAACATPDEVRAFLEDDFGASPEQWQTMDWLRYKAHLPPAEGGIGKYGGEIWQELCRRFPRGAYTAFLDWMGLTISRTTKRATKKATKAERNLYCDNVAACATPAEFTALFDKLGIPEDKRFDGEWLRRSSMLSPEEGGMGTPMYSLAAAIRDDRRFKSFVNFCEFMKTGVVPVDIVARFAACVERADYLALARDIGIGDNWEQREKMQELSKQRKAEGRWSGVWTFYRLVSEKFGRYRKFVQWMNDEAQGTYGELVKACQTPDDMKALLATLGVPGEAWRRKGWFSFDSGKPVEEGGIGRTLSGFPSVIDADPRFGDSWEAFVAWMDGTEAPPPTMRKQMKDIETREQYVEFFANLGIPGDNWKSSNWLERVAPLATEEGGVGRSYQSVAKQIRKRHGSFPAFVAWMEGAEKTTVKQDMDKLHTRDDFRAYFKGIGVPGEEWRRSSWLGKEAKLSLEEGGINKSLCAQYNYLKRRFGKFRQFLAWMDEKEKPEPTRVEAVAAMTEREHFLAYFASIGVPGDAWRSSRWMTKLSKLPPERGGMGENLAGLGVAIATDPRFKGYLSFVAWMDGLPLGGIENEQQAAELLRAEAVKLRVSVEELLDPASVTAFSRRSPVVAAVIAYFDEKQRPSPTA